MEVFISNNSIADNHDSDNRQSIFTNPIPLSTGFFSHRLRGTADPPNPHAPSLRLAFFFPLPVTDRSISYLTAIGPVHPLQPTSALQPLKVRVNWIADGRWLLYMSTSTLNIKEPAQVTR